MFVSHGLEEATWTLQLHADTLQAQRPCDPVNLLTDENAILEQLLCQ